MPCYPALALLLGSAMAVGGNWSAMARACCAEYLSLAAAAVLTLYALAWNLPTPGDISAALSVASRRIQAFARTHGRSDHRLVRLSSAPAASGGVAFLVGAAGTFRAKGQRAFWLTALMAVLFFQAARIAMAAFDPFLSSRPLADALLRVARGKAHRGPSLLHVFVDLLLYQSRLRCCSMAGSITWCTAPTRPARRMFSLTTRNGRRCGSSRSDAIW